jgi:hypothetical protein
VALELAYPRARSSDARRLIDDLLLVHGERQLAMLLGVKTIALHWQKHPLPVCRAALMLHLLTFSGGDKVKVFDLLTGCRYACRDRVQVAGNRLKTPQA